eukprot:s2440_g16.t1
MPRLLKQIQKEPDLVQRYAAAFAKEPALKEVGFNFISAHSKGLFDSRAEATIKDVERNPEAVFAIMSVAPSIRLSEETLAKAILLFYTTSKLVPVGITEEALEEWLFVETPGNAKSSVLKQLKQRCLDAGLGPAVEATDDSESSSRAASHEDLDSVAPAPSKASSGFDWSRLQKRLQERLGDKLELLAESRGLKQKPVATPARARDALPDFVLESLSKQVPAVAPFATTAGEDDAAAEKEPKTNTKKAKSKAVKNKGGKKKSKKQQEIAGPEVEEALKLDEPAPCDQSSPAGPEQRGASPSQSLDPAALLQQPDVKYNPKTFSQMRLAFIKQQKETGMNHAQANQAWMSSNVRADLVSQLPEKEAKRRRSAGTHQRSILFPCGNEGYSFVRIGNLLASRVALLAYFSLALLCRFVVEQPGGSAAEIHPRMQQLFDKYSVYRTAIWGANYANDNNCSPKRHWLYGNDRMFLQRLAVAAGYLSKEKMQELTGDLVKRVRKEDGTWSWSGRKDALQASQQYHERFGAHIAELKKEMADHQWEALGSDIDWKQEEDIDLWEDVWPFCFHGNQCGDWLLWQFVIAEAKLFEVITYLREQSSFRPSDRWSALLDRAYRDVKMLRQMTFVDDE